MKKTFTSKTLSIFSLILMFPLLMNAQSGTSSHKLTERKISGSPSVKSLLTSLNSTNNYVPGTTMNLTFSFTFISPDGDFLDGLSMTFPAGITPNVLGSSDPLAPDNGGCGTTVALNTPVGQTISWGNIISPSYCGALTAGTYVFTVNVTIGSGVSGIQTVNYTAYADGYNSIPPYSTNGTSDINQFLSDDIGITSVDLNGAYVPGNITPKATVKNFGSSAQNNFTVRMKINSIPAYDQTVTISTSLDPDSSIQVSFPTWTASLGNWTATAITLMAGDANPANDSLQKNVNVFQSLTSAFCFKNNTQPSKFFLEAPGDGFFDMGAPTVWFARGGSYVPVGTSSYKWFVMGSEDNLYSVDTLTGIPTLIGPTGVPVVGTYFFPGLTYDVTTTTLYGGYVTGSFPLFTFSLYKIDQTTGAATLVAVGDSIGKFFDIACDGIGNLFALEHRPSANGRLWSINKTTAAMTIIGTDLGAAPSSNSTDIEFAPNGNLYFTATNIGDGNMDGLYIINTTTGTATLVGTFPAGTNMVTGLAIKNDYPLYVGINNGETLNNSITLFPNPTTNKISVVSKNDEVINVIKVFSISGQLVYQEDVNFIATTLNTTNYENGYYFVVVSTEKGTYTQKFVVAR